MDLWAGTVNGVVRLGDEGATELPGVHVTALSCGRADVWCLDDRNALWQRNHDGWSEVARAMDTGLCCVLETSVGVLVGTTDARLLRLEDGSLVPVDAFDRVDGRERWWNVGGLGPVANVRSLAQAPDGPLYANVHVGGIYRSDDGGTSWTSTIDQEADVHEIVALSQGRLLAATGMSGLVRSPDGGTTWTSVTDGLPADGWGGYTRSIAVWDDDTVLITGSRGAFSDLDGGVDAGVYRWSADGPDRLERCHDGLPSGFEDNIDTGRLTSAPGYAAFGADDRVYVTEDAGEHWRVLASGLPTITCLVARA